MCVCVFVFLFAGETAAQCAYGQYTRSFWYAISASSSLRTKVSLHRIVLAGVCVCTAVYLCAALLLCARLPPLPFFPSSLIERLTIHLHSPNPLSTDFSTSGMLKIGLRTQKAISQQRQALSQWWPHCWKDLLIAHLINKKYSTKPSQARKLHGPEWRKSQVENPVRKANRSWPVEQLWSSFFHKSTAQFLAVVCCIHSQTFWVTIEMHWAKSRPTSPARRSIEREIDQLGHFKWL